MMGWGVISLHSSGLGFGNWGLVRGCRLVLSLWRRLAPFGETVQLAPFWVSAFGQFGLGKGSWDGVVWRVVVIYGSKTISTSEMLPLL